MPSPSTHAHGRTHVSHFQALEVERKRGRHAVEALESVHLEAGVNTAQEMTQLRLELTALHEELEFLRARQAKVHEEEHRLQMVAEMSKRLGTTVSKFELEALRSQVASLTQEAERIQLHNSQLQSEAKRAASDEAAVISLQAEIRAFQVCTTRACEARHKHADVSSACLCLGRERFPRSGGP